MRARHVIAIGGGLAGAAFALEVARNGVRVTVLERTSVAHHKACGEFVSPETQRLLAYLGIDVMRLGASAIGKLRLVSSELTATIALPFQGMGLSRHTLDQALLDAAGVAGAEVCRGVHVTGLEIDGTRVAVSAGARKLRADAVALATGKHNIRGHPRRAGDKVAMKIQLTPSPAIDKEMENTVQLAGFDGGYVGACHVEAGRLTLCWLMEPPLLKRIGPQWAAHADYLSGVSPFVADIIANAKPRWSPAVSVAGLPLGYLRRQALSPHVYPLGDQLAVIPSYTGDGMAIALSSGIAAAQSLLRGQGAHAFQSQQLARLGPQFRVARVVNLLFETSASRRLGLTMAARLPGLVPWIIRKTRVRGYERLIGAGSAPPGRAYGR